MDEFEKVIQEISDRKLPKDIDWGASPKSIYSFGFNDGKVIMAQTLLAKYRSMTCKMTSHFIGDDDVRWECSKCRETMKNPDKYCTHCGRKVIE